MLEEWMFTEFLRKLRPGKFQKFISSSENEKKIIWCFYSFLTPSGCNPDAVRLSWQKLVCDFLKKKFWKIYIFRIWKNFCKTSIMTRYKHLTRTNKHIYLLINCYSHVYVSFENVCNPPYTYPLCKIPLYAIKTRLKTK